MIVLVLLLAVIDDIAVCVDAHSVEDGFAVLRFRYHLDLNSSIDLERVD